MDGLHHQACAGDVELVATAPVRRWIGTWCAERMVIGELMRGSGRYSMAARRWLPQFRVHHVLSLSASRG